MEYEPKVGPPAERAKCRELERKFPYGYDHCGRAATHVLLRHGSTPRLSYYTYLCPEHAKKHGVKRALPIDDAPGRPVDNIIWDREAPKEAAS